MFEKTARPILPRELSLGSRTELRVKNNKRQQVIVPDTFIICCTSKTEAQEVFDHNLMHIRSRPDYEQHLRQNKFGVQSECALNELQYFDFLNSPSVDIMHDLLEGVVPFEIKIVLQKLISLGCFSLEIVNQRLMAHNYGYLESKNRPNPIRLDSTGHKIGQKAAQAWCLIRHLPVILADLIVSEEGIIEKYNLADDVVISLEDALTTLQETPKFVISFAESFVFSGAPSPASHLSSLANDVDCFKHLLEGHIGRTPKLYDVITNCRENSLADTSSSKIILNEFVTKLVELKGESPVTKDQKPPTLPFWKSSESISD
ncbi:hypothetical protein Fcan01_21940 [Folsomia candida]|uniref:Uncharacterized protein n=1 Tax=Folsomia candida TaxID=158441 RepID=A0A226DDX9_FOLCA|nr:hypothetical protein Fcan01_21940 [Folsomia candida]